MQPSGPGRAGRQVPSMHRGSGSIAKLDGEIGLLKLAEKEKGPVVVYIFLARPHLSSISAISILQGFNILMSSSSLFQKLWEGSHSRSQTIYCSDTHVTPLFLCTKQAAVRYAAARPVAFCVGSPQY